MSLIRESSKNYSDTSYQPQKQASSLPQGTQKTNNGFTSSDSIIRFEKEEVDNSANNNMIPNMKLPLTMVGNVALSKGMYLTLMKRREQRAFGNTSYSSTPRLQSTSMKINSNKSYSSCARINAQSNSKYNNQQSQHSFKVPKNTKSTKKKFAADENEIMLRSSYQQGKVSQYKDIHKTKKIQKENNKKSVTGRRRRKQSDGDQSSEGSILRDITDTCHNIENKNNSNIREKNKQSYGTNDKMDDKKKVSINKNINKGKSQQSKQPQQKSQISTMRERSKQYKQENNPTSSRVNSKISNKGEKEKISDEEEYDQNINDKENRMGSSNISNTSSSSTNNSSIKNTNSQLHNPFSGLQDPSRNIWHEEALDMQTERAMFIQKLKKDKKKKYSQSPKRIVPGFRVKFETSRQKIYQFNCFRDKDLCIDKLYRDTINLEQDNDFDTDCEQIKESIINVFQSLCVAVCEEKINSQIMGKTGQTQSSIY